MHIAYSKWYENNQIRDRRNLDEHALEQTKHVCRLSLECVGRWKRVHYPRTKTHVDCRFLCHFFRRIQSLTIELTSSSQVNVKSHWQFQVITLSFPVERCLMQCEVIISGMAIVLSSIVRCMVWCHSTRCWWSVCPQSSSRWLNLHAIYCVDCCIATRRHGGSHVRCPSHCCGRRTSDVIDSTTGHVIRVATPCDSPTNCVCKWVNG